MTHIPQQSMIRSRPQPNIYTLLLVVSIIALGATIGVAIWNLTTIYGLKFGEIFQPLKAVVGA